MKLHYTKILLFSLSLIILAHNKNKACITTHTRTTTSRVLSECDIYTSIYDNDEDMKSVKENFDRQTSQRFEEYEERMNEKRQKCKEQCDKDIEQIILRDKTKKSLEEKVEKGCLKCGCGLGGVAASVGLFGGLGIYGWKSAALATAIAEGAAKGAVAAEAARIAEGIKAVISGLNELGVSTLKDQPLVSYLTTMDYTNASLISIAINKQYDPSSCMFFVSGTGSSPGAREPICTWVKENFVSQGNGASINALIKKTVESIVTDSKTVAETAAKKATEEAIKASTDAVESAYASCQTAIIASIVAIVVIVLIMVIIYLILRYRRKKKMKKKLQYIKLLEE
ncbi:rifin [Plasmodium falciparum IGH-CR14]|uniref:Rifin n=1 Tax=Plasmodium falciparum IGH-CR14 TaxID=580059 RepID=A0A0L1I8E3_PLAFA|nr:rifin [Plasmodium falciparum IGH-CR14]